jgi:hypothetical protein
VARLVLDGVVEIEGGDGIFVAGAAAYRTVFGAPAAELCETVTGRLSLEALEDASRFATEDARRLSMRLYRYNHCPASAVWRRQLPSERALLAYLRIGGQEGSTLALEQGWTAVTSNESWLSWVPSRRVRESLGDPVTYKLYVSPRAEYLPEAFHTAIDIFTRVGAASFKVGRDVYGVLRPDKFVAYFTAVARMHEAAGRLRNALSGMPAQGVPFTAALEESGLLSWGVDRPHNEQLLPRLGASWRLWLTERLATAIVSARVSPEVVEPWRFAVDRVGLEGIDTSRWAPRLMDC